MWIYSDLKEKCCDAVCKEEVGTTCLLARMSSSNDRNIKSACGESSDSVSDFLSASGFQAASCSDTKDDRRQILCMCSVVSADAVSPSCTAWAEDKACPAGYTGPDDACAACPEGKFKPDVGSHACTDCPDNSNTDASGNPLTTDATGSDELSDCKCNTGFTGTLTTSSDCCANAAGGADSCSNPPAPTTTPTPTTPTRATTPAPTTPTPTACEVGRFANVSGNTTTCICARWARRPRRRAVHQWPIALVSQAGLATHISDKTVQSANREHTRTPAVSLWVAPTQ